MVDLTNIGRGKRAKDAPPATDAAPDVPAPAESPENTPATDAAPATPRVDLAALAKKAEDVADVGKSVRHRTTSTEPLPLEAEVLATIDTGKAKAIPVPTLDVAKEVMNAVRRVGNRHDKGTKVRVYDVSAKDAEHPDGALVQYRRDKTAKRYFWSTTDGAEYKGAGPFSVRFQATADRKHRTNGTTDASSGDATTEAPSSESTDNPASVS